MLAAIIAASQFYGTAFAQTSSATVAAPAASSVAEAPAAKPLVNVNYLGIMYGPAIKNDDGRIYNGAIPYLDNRPSIKANLSDNVDVGLQARFNVVFQSDGMDAANASWRLFNNVKNIYKDDVLQFNMLTRAVLPTSRKNHNQAMLPSPELLPTLNITPKNSRFNLAIYPQYIHYFYNDAAASSKALSNLLCGNFEGTYQLTGNTAITFGYYPEIVSQRDRAAYFDMSELDLGFSWDFVKGWTVNPFLATEFLDMGKNNASMTKNMALNVVLTGALL
ncbi:MAG: hypothetical protein JST80_10705 [Bdellovibrionales bacterium]|nr:hypothetical protein [Bdellovibrionales bacterium]